MSRNSIYGSLISLRKFIWRNALASAIRFWNATELIHFWNDWLLATKSGQFITTLIGKDRGWCKMNQSRRDQKLRFTKKRLCCQFGGIMKEFCTLNFYQETKRLIQTCTFNDSPNWAMQFKKSGQNWQIVRVLFSSMIMQSPTHLCSLVKNYWI